MEDIQWRDRRNLHAPQDLRLREPFKPCTGQHIKRQKRSALCVYCVLRHANLVIEKATYKNINRLSHHNFNRFLTSRQNFSILSF